MAAAHPLQPYALAAGALAFAALSVATARWEPPAPSCLAHDGERDPFPGEYWLCSRGESEFRIAPLWPWIARIRALPAALSAAYLLALLAGTRAMANRSPIRLPRLRTAWNLGLSAFSAAAFSRVAPALAVSTWRLGPVDAFCAAPSQDGPSGLWGCLFALSKAPELLDTLFLVLQRKPLSLLHTWHHASVLPFCALQALLVTGPFALGVAMNTAVHTAMYAYYAAVEWNLLQGPLARRVAMGITAAQTSQMAVGIAAAVALGRRAARGDGACRFDGTQALLWVFLYGTYLVLFLRFADQAYGLRGR
eukprot:CAMPEP_0206002604 /NCGR_PEP_ID=MMETSP1464-20131121/2852_1 /ASSEMBLY_ACC=CAM_ASM_001124 /TAXON_ID=119497 /ORGANISM="Exanthemachrysis gayraliae, Strain RCC1523" /LENGTH=306 /DNA_ID=CAMNT_0053375951 /DNA_START=14 /DNA_END=930 /DNA_ORIENTATION=+